jgi:hypothetical protein
MNMKSFLAATVVASAIAFAPAASAADFFPGDPQFTVSGDPINGPVSGNIGNSGIAAGTFTDRFLFTIGADGLGSGSVATSLSGDVGGTTDLDFLEIIFNNGVQDYIVPLSSMGTSQFGAISNVPIFAEVLNTLSITYLSRGDGSYGGNLTFTPTGAIPEPMTWALMLLGFAAVGYAMRRRPKQQVRVNYAL